MAGTSINGYRFLRTLLPLPSPETILKMLRKLKSKPGISDVNIRNLKTKVNPVDFRDKQVFLLLDEMSIRQGLAFDQMNYTIIGFQDNGHSRSNALANHALVVMAVGVVRK